MLDGLSTSETPESAGLGGSEPAMQEESIFNKRERSWDVEVRSDDNIVFKVFVVIPGYLPPTPPTALPRTRPAAASSSAEEDYHIWFLVLEQPVLIRPVFTQSTVKL